MLRKQQNDLLSQTGPDTQMEHQKVRSASVVLPPDQAFKEAAKEALTARPGVAQASV